MHRPYFDSLETRSADAREAAHFAALPELIALAQRRADGYVSRLAGIDPYEVTGRAALARLPLLRKSELPALQAGRPPFGGLATVAPGQLRRIFASPGPIFEAEGREPDAWRMARALHASGIGPGMVVLNCFSYHFTPAGVMMEEGAGRLGAAVIPAGTGNTELQARAVAALRPQAYVGTPDFLKAILEKAAELGLDATSLRLAHVSGGPFLPPLKTAYDAAGITVFQSYGIADLGLIAYETQAREGLVVDESVIVEIVRPGTADPVPVGEVGEVVVTCFNRSYPLIRLATGDLSALLPGTSPCGRTGPRLAGWKGRADQTTKIRGLFVRPEQVAEVLSRHGLRRGRLVVEAPEGADTLTLEVEGASDAALADTLREVTKLRGEVRHLDAGSLPNDGKVIDDRRPLPG